MKQNGCKNFLWNTNLDDCSFPPYLIFWKKSSSLGFFWLGAFSSSVYPKKWLLIKVLEQFFFERGTKSLMFTAAKKHAIWLSVKAWVLTPPTSGQRGGGTPPPKNGRVSEHSWRGSSVARDQNQPKTHTYAHRQGCRFYLVLHAGPSLTAAGGHRTGGGVEQRATLGGKRRAAVG